MLGLARAAKKGGGVLLEAALGRDGQDEGRVGHQGLPTMRSSQKEQPTAGTGSDGRSARARGPGEAELCQPDSAGDPALLQLRRMEWLRGGRAGDGQLFHYPAVYVPIWRALYPHGRDCELELHGRTAIAPRAGQWLGQI